MSIVDFSTGDEMNLPDISEMSKKLEKMFPTKKKEMHEILTILYKNKSLIELKRTRKLDLSSLKENILITSSHYDSAQEGLKVIAEGLGVPIYFLCAGCFLGEDYNKYLTDAIDNLKGSNEGSILVLEDLDLLQYDTDVDSYVSKEREKLASSIVKQLLSSSYWKIKRYDDELASRYIGDISFVGIGNIKGIVKKCFPRVIGFYSQFSSYDEIIALVQNSPIIEDHLKLLKELGIDLILEPSFADYIARTVNNYAYGSLPNTVTGCINKSLDEALLELLSSGNKDLETSIPSKKYDELHLKEPDSASKQKPYQLVKKRN